MPSFTETAQLKELKKFFSSHMNSIDTTVTKNPKAKEIYNNYIELKKALKKRNYDKDDLIAIIDFLFRYLKEMDKLSQDEWDDMFNGELFVSLREMAKRLLRIVGSDSFISDFPKIERELLSLKKYVNDKIEEAKKVQDPSIYDSSLKNDLQKRCLTCKDIFADCAVSKIKCFGELLEEKAYIEYVPINTSYIRVLAGVAGIKDKRTPSEGQEFYEPDLFGTGFIGLLFAKLYHLIKYIVFDINVPKTRRSALKHRTKGKTDGMKRPATRFADTATVTEYPITKDELELKGKEDLNAPMRSTEEYKTVVRNKKRAYLHLPPVETSTDPENEGYK